MVIGFDLSSIASIGRTITLMIFAFDTTAHLRVYRQPARDRGCSSSPCW